MDRLLSFANELCFNAFRGGPIFFFYLKALGLRAKGYCRIDSRHLSELDLIHLGACTVIAEGAKLRPAVAEALQLCFKPFRSLNTYVLRHV